MQYRIGKRPKSTAGQNIVTWQKLEMELAIAGTADFDQLVRWCKDHDHAAGGRGFVNYCIKSEWLVPAAQNSSSQFLSPIIKELPLEKPIVNNEYSDSGIYIAVLLTEQFMPVTRDPRYTDNCARVNNQNVKIGRAESLKKRERDYWKDFDAHNVEFIPIALLNDIKKAETAIKQRLDSYRLLSPKNGKMDWLIGIEPMTVVNVAYDVLISGGYEFQKVKNKFTQF